MLAARTRSAGREDAEEHGHPDGCHHPAAGALQDPEGHELGHVLGQPAEHRTDGEDDDGREQHPLAAEAVTEPAGRGNEHGQADEVGDDDAVDGCRRDVEVATDRGQATLTIVMSMMFMNMADTKTMPTPIFWFMRGLGMGSFTGWRALTLPPYLSAHGPTDSWAWTGRRPGALLAGAAGPGERQHLVAEQVRGLDLGYIGFLRDIGFDQPPYIKMLR